MSKVKFILLIGALFLVQVVLAACGGEKSSGEKDETKVVHIGVQGATGILPYAREKGYFEKAYEEVGVEVEWHEFASGPPHFEAISSGRLDFGFTGGSPVIAGQAGGVDFKALAVTSDGKKENAIVVPKDSEIKSLSDLKGKKIGVAKGSSAYNFLYLALDKAGLTDKDIKIVQLQPEEGRPALDNGGIDAWSIWEPYASTVNYQTEARYLVTGADLDIVMPSFLIGRTEFVENNPELTKIFLETYEEARKYVAENLEEVSQDIAGIEGVEYDIIYNVYSKANLILSPTTEEFLEAHQAQADFLYSAGGIKKEIDTSEVMDNQYVEEVLKGQ
ncbi:MAG: aliphatic sulfonate ABC transporter substrate-binding protein [Bacillus sp. (in: firmicutes)]